MSNGNGYGFLGLLILGFSAALVILLVYWVAQQI